LAHQVVGLALCDGHNYIRPREDRPEEKLSVPAERPDSKGIGTQMLSHDVCCSASARQGVADNVRARSTGNDGASACTTEPNSTPQAEEVDPALHASARDRYAARVQFVVAAPTAI
jgi:hypothetical protein